MKRKWTNTLISSLKTAISGRNYTIRNSQTHRHVRGNLRQKLMWLSYTFPQVKSLAGHVTISHVRAASGDERFPRIFRVDTSLSRLCPKRNFGFPGFKVVFCEDWHCSISKLQPADNWVQWLPINRISRMHRKTSKWEIFLLDRYF